MTGVNATLKGTWRGGDAGRRKTTKCARLGSIRGRIDVSCLFRAERITRRDGVAERNRRGRRRRKLNEYVPLC